MAVKIREVLKAWFAKGKYPTAANFSDMIDSFYHRADDLIPLGRVESLPAHLNTKLNLSEARRMDGDIDALRGAVAAITGRLGKIDAQLDMETLTALRADLAERLVSFRRMEELAAQVTQVLPLRMTLSYPRRITLGNRAAQRIAAELLPTPQRPNLLYLGDDGAVSVTPAGELTVNRTGRSRIHVIPTTATELYKTVEIEVVPPAPVVASQGGFLMAGGGILLT